ncbi:aminopeptidase [Cuneatibacter sp. NSJ-177]|uniref:aminopeptidase n=1 Tax=Cuneatibacter sp. NSJ-177 TaxID=2931401 RepID=UPI001FD06C7F|nr:aminopeptidase [Cuneatibacter sp. NSJ-177]MCJ7837372.1 aminopeptidase [Cuneatibacter sp. NSJ-177]
MYEYELVGACVKLLRDMFMMQPGESIAITCDTESSMEIVEATAQAAVILGAKPLVFKIAAPAGGKAGDKDMPMEALIAGIKACDAWIEYNTKLIFYSTVYDKIVEDPNNRPRYMNQNGVHPDLLVRNIGKVDNILLNQFIMAMSDATEKANHIRVTNPAGTDIEFDNEPGREFVTADGFVRKGEVKMFPGQISWAPRFESINGVLVVDGSQNPPMGLLSAPIRFTVEKGVITKVEGGSEAQQFEEWLRSFDDPQMFRVAHLAYGFGPAAKLTGDVVEDERVWGCTEWGFGNVGAILTSDIPEGIPGASHSDGICLNCSVWLDGVQVLDNGTVVGPTPEIVEMARALGK